METKHTKGEWNVSSSFLIVNKDGKVLANCMPIGIEALEVPVEESFANSKLIAAAPDMLKALEFVKNMLEYEKMTNTEEYYLVSNAIKKAI